MSEPYPNAPQQSTTGYAPSYPGQPTSASWDGMAIAGFVLSFIFWPVGLVLSILGLRNTRRNGTRGRGLAIAGIVISIVNFLLGILVLVTLLPAMTAGTY